MKIEKLTDNKIRIILNIDDLAKKNIDVHTLIKNNDISQKLFRKILRQAQKEVGFDAQDSRILIEAYISTEGFFILTFTKLAEEIKIEKDHFSRIKKKISNLSTTAIYQFKSFDEYMDFCKYINDSKLGDLKQFAKKISLYEFNSFYFLVFDEIDTNYSYSDLFYTSISEFAKLISNSLCFESKLIEYGKIIFKNNAIAKGINFFSMHKM